MHIVLKTGIYRVIILAALAVPIQAAESKTHRLSSSGQLLRKVGTRLGFTSHSGASSPGSIVKNSRLSLSDPALPGIERALSKDDTDSCSSASCSEGIPSNSIWATRNSRLVKSAPDLKPVEIQFDPDDNMGSAHATSSSSESDDSDNSLSSSDSTFLSEEDADSFLESNGAFFTDKEIKLAKEELAKAALSLKFCHSLGDRMRWKVHQKSVRARLRLAKKLQKAVEEHGGMKAERDHAITQKDRAEKQNYKMQKQLAYWFK